MALLRLIALIHFQQPMENATQVLMTDGNGLLNWTDIPTGMLLADADNDTKIQVEESNDEDIIRFDLNGQNLCV